ncbi:cytochrome P450 [Suillus lakei]|nr:cytochrome P450 [Suillus lakei]
MLQPPDLHISSKTQLVLGAAACVGVIGVIVRTYLRKSDTRLPLPPSPPTWRLRGHFLPPDNPSLTVAKWIDEYGPLITIRSGIENIVIIGRYKAAVDIMEKQGALLADRPHSAAGELLFRGLCVSLTHVGDRFRRQQHFHTHLQPTSAEAYQPLQMSHVKNVVLNILDDPHNFQNHVGTQCCGNDPKVAYGKTMPTSATGPEIREARQLVQRFRVIMRPGAYLVDSIPWLKYLPGYASELKDDKCREMRRLGPSFAKYILENEHLYGLTEIEMAYLVGDFFAAGTETTGGAICTVLMAAAHFPEEQAEVQAELDAVIGRERAPTFADKQSLHRLVAFISEALRWRLLAANVHPAGFPHRTTEDENYRIPAGTTVTGNHWAISRDPEVYPEPDAFKPQRWIDDQGRLRDDITHFLYGFGRRVCPGQHLANRSVFIHSLLILWAFQLSLDLTKPQDDMAFTNTVLPGLCAIEFKTRVPEVELRHMMQNFPEAG